MIAKKSHLAPCVLLTALLLAACHPDSHQVEKANALFQQGVEQSTNNSVAAIEAYNQALLILSTCDQNAQEVLRLKAQITNQLGTRYWKNGLIEHALSLHNEAIDIARLINDSTLLMDALHHAGRVASSLHDINLVNQYYQEAYQIAQILQDQPGSSEILLEIARDVDMEQGAYDVAIQKTMEALQNGAREDLCYLNLGLCYYYIENDSIAIDYLNKAWNSEKAGVRMSAYQGLYFIYQLQEDYQHALSCLELFNENLLQSEHEQRTEEVQRIKGEYDLAMQQQYIKASQHLKNLYLYALLGFLVVALLLTLLLLRQRTLKAKLKSEEMKNQLEMALKKNKVFVTALALSEHITASSIDFNINEKEWDDFVELVDMVYNHFTQRLLAQYPTLTKGDLQICCLTKQGFGNQVISILMNLQTNSFARRKYRIKQEKMNGLNDDRSFEEIINNL